MSAYGNLVSITSAAAQNLYDIDAPQDFKDLINDVVDILPLMSPNMPAVYGLYPHLGYFSILMPEGIASPEAAEHAESIRRITKNTKRILEGLK